MKKIVFANLMKVVPCFFLFYILLFQSRIVAQELPSNVGIVSFKKVNSTTVEIENTDKHKLILDFYSDNIVRFFQDNSGKDLHGPEAKPFAEILVQNPRKPLTKLDIKEEGGQIEISTANMTVLIDKNTSLFKLINRKNQTLAAAQILPIVLKDNKVTLTLAAQPDEYFYGGGVQNGRFSHKGKSIAIENQNSWTDGGVASPTPFYWSNKGYGVLFYTFKKGRYDFESIKKGTVSLSHETDYLDVFFMVNQGAVPLLNDFYQLTGNPVLVPKFGFYEGHLNAFNRDYWKSDDTGILFEDGVKYKESQKDNGGTKESLNGEKNNYQFSARAVIDRYKKNDMPLGWILPNDGYGAGYGQSNSLDGNIANLKSFGDYARKNGVEIGLWTQSDLHPKPSVSPLLQRDIIKEVREAGVRVLKTDVAWVGAGYSFGLNGVADAGSIIPKYGNNSRPFIISLDGWAGTQRYATIWSGDQTGGNWEYIRFHIPTYLGAGLSGQPNITSDMDGIFGGKNNAVNMRDFQWKTFTPMQLNMDGWGLSQKYPHAQGEPATSINRTYLKLKSALLPYQYTVAKEAVNGLPIMRAMFLSSANHYTQGTPSQYQYMFGPSFLVAPIYQATKADADGNDVRNNIYLPEGRWVDYFSGDVYNGNMIINNFDAPIWKLPVFVKGGAIIPMANPNNNPSEIDKALRTYEVYLLNASTFTEYDDDGITEAYKEGSGVSTFISSAVEKTNASVTIEPSSGNYYGFVKNKATSFIINIGEAPKGVSAKIGGKKISLKQANDAQEFALLKSAYFYDKSPNLNKYATRGSEFQKLGIMKNPQLLVKLPVTDVTLNKVELHINGFNFDQVDKTRKSGGVLAPPTVVQVQGKVNGAFSLSPAWKKVDHADFYEISFKDMLYSTIKDTTFLFEELSPDTKYAFKLRAVNKDGYSDWVELNDKTAPNPLQFAIKGIKAVSTAEDQSGSGIKKLFDFDENSDWHTKWGQNSIPLQLILDLKSINQLDKIQYLPRSGGGNGVLLKGTIFYSMDKRTWVEAGKFEWARSLDAKIFELKGKPMAAYLKIVVSEGVGGFGSGRELYVFKVPGTESYVPGDINNDKLIDANDLISYTNYTGLRLGDGDFEGYVSKGDINRNNLIDAYDISRVATQLEGGVPSDQSDVLAGSISLVLSKKSYNAGDVVEISVKGKSLANVNAISFGLPYDNEDFEFVSIKPLAVKHMENLSYDRLHSNLKKALYPTFVNVGNKETLNGDTDLFIIKLKAKRKLTFNLKAVDGLLVSKDLATVNF